MFIVVISFQYRQTCKVVFQTCSNGSDEWLPQEPRAHALRFSVDCLRCCCRLCLQGCLAGSRATRSLRQPKLGDKQSQVRTDKATVLW